MNYAHHDSTAPVSRGIRKLLASLDRTVGEWSHRSHNFCAYCVVWWHHKKALISARGAFFFKDFRSKHRMEPEESLRCTAITTTLSHFQHSQLKQWLWEGFKGVFWQLLYPVAGQISEQKREGNEGRLSKIHRSLFKDFLIVAAAGKAGRAFKCYF